MALDPLMLKDTVDPKIVQTGLLDDDNRKGLAGAHLSLSRSCAKRASSPAISPPRTACFDVRSPPPGNSDVTAASTC